MKLQKFFLKIGASREFVHELVHHLAAFGVFGRFEIL
jgi:hypothetical protein